MGQTYDHISDGLKEWIAKQKMFFVATAPIHQDGLINLSPKGHDSFRILDKTTVAYRDLTGSGIETVAHLKENGRIVIMFCSFEGAPKIVRFHGRGDAIEPHHPEFAKLSAKFGLTSEQEDVSTRAFIRVAVSRISDSCGYSVPLYDYVSDRDVLLKWVESKGPEGVTAYQRTNNVSSLDGLRGLD